MVQLPQTEKEKIMKTIGTFAKEGKYFNGRIYTLTLNLPASFEPLAKKGEKAPDYRIISDGSDIGAAWKKISQDGNEYISVSLDDPSFVAPINCRLVKTGVEIKHSLIWERARKQD
jgi:uncharacterized protein (DUF736 family)